MSRGTGGWRGADGGADEAADGCRSARSTMALTSPMLNGLLM